MLAPRSKDETHEARRQFGAGRLLGRAEPVASSSHDVRVGEFFCFCVFEGQPEPLVQHGRALTQRLFLTFSEVEVRVDGVFVVSRHRDAVAAPVRASRGGFMT